MSTPLGDRKLIFRFAHGQPGGVMCSPHIIRAVGRPYRTPFPCTYFPATLSLPLWTARRGNRVLIPYPTRGSRMADARLWSHLAAAGRPEVPGTAPWLRFPARSSGCNNKRLPV